MTDRPIEQGVDDLQEARDQASRELDGLFDVLKGDVDAIARLVERAKVGRAGTNPAADIAGIGRAMQGDARNLGNELGAILDRAATDLDELRRPADGQVTAAAVAPSPAPAVVESAAPELAVIEVTTVPGERHPALRHPPPNSIITVDQTVVYTTDQLGRVISAQAVLTETTPDQPRDNYAQRTTTDKLPGDHAGHIIARILGGIGQHINLVPMEGRRVNQGQYATLEDRWQKAVEAGKPVDLEVRLYYNDQTRRPFKIQVFYEIDGRVRRSTIYNTPASEGSA